MEFGFQDTFLDAPGETYLLPAIISYELVRGYESESELRTSYVACW